MVDLHTKLEIDNAHVVVLAYLGNVIYRKLAVQWNISYLLTPRCRVLLEQLTGLQIVKKFPAFHGTRRVITALTTVRHLYLYWASPIQSIHAHPSSWTSILILSTHLRLGLSSGLLTCFNVPALGILNSLHGIMALCSKLLFRPSSL